MLVSCSRGRRCAGAFLAAGLSVLLGACGGAEEGGGSDNADGGEIPSLATAPATAADETAPPERPLIRSDTSPEEEERLYARYQRCVEENGAGVPDRFRQDDDAGPRAVELTEEERELDAAVQVACEHLMPERLWERAQRTDPEYADKLAEWVTCIRSHGIDAWEDSGFLTFHSLPPEQEMVKVHECEEKAFT